LVGNIALAFDTAASSLDVPPKEEEEVEEVEVDILSCRSRVL
jgi:hypothetical protein